MSRGAVFVFLIALLIGVGGGIYLGWVVFPVRATETDPASLRTDYKEDYVLMIATIYAADHDLDTARAHLARLGVSESGVATIGQRWVLANAAERDLRALAQLAAHLNVLPPELQPYAP